MNPMALHEVRLLGRPAMRGHDGEWSDLKPGFMAALLGYLAFEGRWVERGELVALFWPDRREEVARANLRPLLWRLAHEPLIVDVERERTRVRWPVRTDHEAFVDACRAERWADAWNLRGELLAGVSLPAAPEFETWLEMERATVQSAVRTAGLRAAEEATRAGDDERAAKVLGDLYRADPFDEAVLRALLGALDRRGSGTEALVLLTKFERLCHEELEAEPEPATQALGAAIRGGRTERAQAGPSRVRDSGGGAAARSGVTSLPVPLTPFVGRHDLMDAVSRRLVDEACRVLTLVGPGGVGKTRIAIEVARSVGDRFEEGARFVELAAVSNEGALVAAVARSAGIGLAAGEDPKAQLLRALASRHLLLVLDNAEHLEEAAALVAELVAGAPDVKILITSRRPTALAAECLTDVVGLDHRDEGRQEQRPRSDGAKAPSLTEAAELFGQVARRAGVSLDSTAGATIERLCAKLGGVPLAIELAAGWTRVLNPDEIEAELTRGLDILRDGAVDRASRHASMRAVFEASWAALHARERAAMRRLAPFRSGFTLDAARQAASITLPVLLALTNKSFLRRTGDGRFSRHPLVWQYARERAGEQPDELKVSRDRHAAYFLRFLAERREAYQHPEGERMMLEIHNDLENVTAAWRWACERAHLTWLRSAVSSLGRYCWGWGRYDLQDQLLPPAIEIAAGDAVLLGLLLVQQASARTWRGVGDLGASLFDEALPMLEEAAGPAEVAWALRGHGIAHSRLGHREVATTSFARAAGLYRQVGDVEGELMMMSSWAPLTYTTGEALSRYELCVREAQAAGSSHALGVVLGGRAGILLVRGEFGAAEASVREAQNRHVQSRSPFWSLDRRNLRALVSIEAGRLRLARALCCRTLAGRGRFASEIDALGDAATVAMAAIARVEDLDEDDVAAEAWAQRALQHHRSRHGPTASYDLAVSALVHVSLRSRDLAAARRWTEMLGRGPEPRWYAGFLNDSATEVAGAVCRAEVALASDDDDAATTAVHSALTLARREELLSPGLGALVPAARILQRRGARARARRVAAFLGGHPRASFETRRAAVRLCGSTEGPRPAMHDHGPEGVLAAFDEALADL
jgi:predicted ATPase/DNA-binding SARP family transcriptional activator/tetratricopeptide (TPR) repeat protein